MMLQQQGVGLPPGLLGTNSGDAAHQAQESGGGGAGGGSFSEEERGRMEEGERNSGGNRWPRQETLALLKIRSDMDVAFRDSSLKGPLWDEVSRKLDELGYHRSAKKCKEKFENVYKYHKRTKDGRTSKADGKTYRFFDQLEALDTHPPQATATATTMTSAPPSHHHLQLPAPLHAQPVSTMPAVTQMPSSATTPIVSQVSTVPSMSMSMNNPMITVSQSHANIPATVSINPTSVAMPMPISTQSNHIHHFAHPNMSGSMMSGSTSSSSTSSDSEPPERRKKRKRKWKDFFGRLMKEVIDKQEELQMKFLDTLEKRERERMIREEAWRVQEMSKMSREHDLLVQERSIAAAKDAAVISFLQKITEQQNAQNPGAPLPQLPVQIQVQEITKQPPPPVSVPVVQQQQQQPPPQPPQQPPYPPQSQPQIPQSQAVAALVMVPAPAQAQPQTPVMKNMNVAKTDNGGGGGDINMLSPSPSRWPKVEVQALIKLRTTLDMKYQENGPKGPLWEEISLAMRKFGYNRNAKRCKEKWENINKYYKKVKESSKKRSEDSKTCPYFHLLDAIYREKGKTDGQFNPNPVGFAVKPENQMAPIMARPEQQWPLPQDQQQALQQQQQRMETSAMDIDRESQNEDDDEDEEEEDEEDEGAGYEIVTNTNNNSNNNKASSMATIE